MILYQSNFNFYLDKNNIPKKSMSVTKTINTIKHDDNYNIIYSYYGKEAIKCIKIIFFNGNQEETNKWINQWNYCKILNSTLIVYERIKYKKRIIGFKFIIGSNKYSYILDKEFPYMIGIDLYSNIAENSKII